MIEARRTRETPALELDKGTSPQWTLKDLHQPQGWVSELDLGGGAYVGTDKA